jgi:pimeloyl-ACP methyl ester carboxylesterase
MTTAPTATPAPAPAAPEPLAAEPPAALRLPWLPGGHTMVLPGRGEVFYRHHRHADPSAPTVLLLHGWTASADLQFFTAYEALAEICSFVAIDHRGHGRGLRATESFELEDAADDAAALLTALGVSPVIAVGYSMGGPISMLLTRRHGHLVRGIVVQATALEWRASRFERVRWKTVNLLGPMLRSWAYPRSIRAGIRRLLGGDHELLPFVPWLAAEMRRNDTFNIVQAGQALSRYDARPWGGELGKPAAMVVTTGDRLVLPRKQRALAAALQAHVVELAGDHLVPWEQPRAFHATTTTTAAD